jgi:hypothetical protein
MVRGNETFVDDIRGSEKFSGNYSTLSVRLLTWDASALNLLRSTLQHLRQKYEYMPAEPTLLPSSAAALGAVMADTAPGPWGWNVTERLCRHLEVGFVSSAMLAFAEELQMPDLAPSIAIWTDPRFPLLPYGPITVKLPTSPNLFRTVHLDVRECASTPKGRARCHTLLRLTPQLPSTHWERDNPPPSDRELIISAQASSIVSVTVSSTTSAASLVTAYKTPGLGDAALGADHLPGVAVNSLIKRERKVLLSDFTAHLQAAEQKLNRACVHFVREKRQEARDMVGEFRTWLSSEREGGARSAPLPSLSEEIRRRKENLSELINEAYKEVRRA